MSDEEKFDEFGRDYYLMCEECKEYFPKDELTTYDGFVVCCSCQLKLDGFVN